MKAAQLEKNISTCSGKIGDNNKKKKLIEKKKKTKSVNDRR